MGNVGLANLLNTLEYKIGCIFLFAGTYTLIDIYVNKLVILIKAQS